MGFSLSVPDIIIIIASGVIVLLIGLRASKGKDQTTRDYFLASGGLRWWLIGSAFVSTSVSSEQIVGTVGQTYESGLGVANWEWCSMPVYTLVILFFIPIYLKNRMTTVSEFLAGRYGPLCADIYSWVMIFAYVFVFLVPVLYGGSLALSELTHWNFYAVLWGMVLLMAAYAVRGGLTSVVWTGAVQCLMLVGGGVVLYFYALTKIDGGIWGAWTAMQQANPERFHLYCPPDDPIAPFLGIIFAFFGVILFYQAGNQVMIQRVLGARSTWDGVMGIIFAGFINFIRPLVTCFLGLIVYHWIFAMKMAEPLANKDQAFSFAMANFAPEWGLRGIILAGFLAAVMSSVSALANSTATLFTLDVYKKLINPDASEHRMVRVGQITSFCALIAAALMAPAVANIGIFKFFQTGVTYLATPFISVLLLGVLWKRMNYQGGLFGIVGGLMIQVGLAIMLPKFGYHLHWLYVATMAQAVTMIGAMIVSLATAPPPQAAWEPFLWSPSLLSHYDAEGVRPWYQQLKLWYGIFAVASIYIYWRFW